jgi:ribose/xylose/arabinose/galactoside ABC-type transport system permease subunit
VSFRTRFAKTPEAGASAGFLAVFLFFALATPNTFLSNSAFSSILNSQAVPGIIAIGITLLMISGEFDLSVGSILGVSSMVFLYATVSGLHILIAGVLGLLAGCLLGLLNGALLIWTGIPSFIVTLGTMLVYRAISLSANAGGRIIRYSEFSRESPTIAPPTSLIFIAAHLRGAHLQSSVCTSSSSSHWSIPSFGHSLPAPYPLISFTYSMAA